MSEPNTNAVQQPTSSTPTDTQPQTTEPQQQQQPITPDLFNEGDNTAQPDTQTSSEPQQQVQAQPQALTEQDITIPEGYEYDKEIGASFLGILNEAKIGRETAQKLFDLYQSQSVKFLESLKAAETEKAKKFEADMAQEKADWLKQCQADKEYGGQNWDAAQAVIDRGCKHLATPEAIKLMQSYNLNTHPEIVRMFYRAGKLVGEDNSQISGNGNTKPIDPAMAIFADSLKDWHRRKDGDK